MHLVNKEMLTMCHYELSGNKATGVDKVTKEEYEANLEVNIDNLLIRMKAFKYRPQPVKRVYIDKQGSKKKDH
jgi:Retron-type reverse transcriptase